MTYSLSDIHWITHCTTEVQRTLQRKTELREVLTLLGLICDRIREGCENFIYCYGRLTVNYLSLRALFPNYMFIVSWSSLIPFYVGTVFFYSSLSHDIFEFTYFIFRINFFGMSPILYLSFSETRTESSIFGKFSRPAFRCSGRRT